MKFSKKRYPHLTKKQFGEIKYSNFLYNAYSKKITDYLTDRVRNLFYRSVRSTYFVSRTYKKHAIDNVKKIAQYRSDVDGNMFSFIVDNVHVFGIVGRECVVVLNGQFALYTKSDGIAYLNNQKITLGKTQSFFCPRLSCNIDIKDMLSFYIIHSTSICLFKKYSKLKNKQINPGGRIKDFNCKYKSDLNIKVALLTENWYTQSCRNHPFVVRGHWRMQACGEALSERKLKWIDTYMQEGMKKGPYKEDMN